MCKKYKVIVISVSIIIIIEVISIIVVALGTTFAKYITFKSIYHMNK